MSRRSTQILSDRQGSLNSAMSSGNPFDVLSDEEPSSSTPAVTMPREDLIQTCCSKAVKVVVKLLFLGKFLMENRNKAQKEVPVQEADRKTIISAHNLMLYTQGNDSLRMSLDASYDHAQRYVLGQSNTFVAQKNKEHMTTQSYHEIKQKVDAFSSNVCFTRERIYVKKNSQAKKKAPVVATTSKSVTFELFLEEKPKLVEDDTKSALLTICGTNIIRGLLDRIVCRFEKGMCGGLELKHVIILNKEIGFIKIDRSTLRRDDMLVELKEDLAGFRSVVCLIRKSCSNVPSLLHGFEITLLSTTMLRDLQKLRCHPLLLSVTERFNLLNNAKRRFAANNKYRALMDVMAIGTVDENLETIFSRMEKHVIIGTKNKSEQKLGTKLGVGQCVTQIRNKVMHINDKCENPYLDNVLDAVVRDVFPEIYSPFFDVKVAWKRL